MFFVFVCWRRKEQGHFSRVYISGEKNSPTFFLLKYAVLLNNMQHHSKNVACKCDIFNQYIEEISQI